MKSKRLLLMLLIAILAPWAANAQSPLLQENFDGSSMTISTDGYSATGWYAYNAGSGNNWSRYNGSAYSGSYCVRYHYNGSNPANCYLVSAPFNVSASMTELSVSLYEKVQSSSYPEIFEVFFVKASDVTNYAGVASATQYGAIASASYTNTSYAQVSSVPVTSDELKGQSVRVVVHCTSAKNMYDLFIDDIIVSQTIFTTTPAPTGLTVSNITHNSADFSWQSPANATPTCYHYNYKKATDTDWEPEGTVNNGTSVSINSFVPLTAYQFRVKADYGTTGQSEYIETSFSTAAQATAVGDNWSDDFEGTECGWELINGTLTNQWAWGTAANNGGTHGLYISNDGGTSNAYSHSAAIVYATKLLNFTEGKYEFSYDWKANGESTYDYLRVALVPATVTLTAGTIPSGFGSSELPTGWIALDGGSKLNLVTAWQSKIMAINVTAGNYYLVMAWRNDGGGGTQPPAAVDNVSITRMACPYDVENLTVATEPAVTQTTATVTWTAGEAEQWQVAYSTNSNFEGATEEVVSNASYNMTGLTAATRYYVKVRAYCGGEDYGTWCEAISFYTACLEYATIPFTENFDDITGVTSGTTNNLPVCWDSINKTTNSSYAGYPVVYNSSSYSNSPNNHLRFYSYLYYNGSSATTSDPKPQYAILPQMQNVNGLRLKLYARAGNTGTNYDASFKVGIMSDPDDANTFELIDTKTPASTTYEQFVIPFNNYTGTGTYIAIMIDAAEGAASAYASYYHYVCIDDITVEEIPNCLEPSDFECTATTATTATFHWTAGGTETAWDLYVSTNNTAPTNSTTPTVSATANNPATVPGLTASTKYYAWVRAHCSDSDQSPWIGGISFITDCEARTIDADHHYTENFNDYTAGSTGSGVPSTYPNDELPLCWQFLNRSENSSTYPMVFLSSNTDYAVSGNCLFFKSSSTTPLYAILPEFTNDISDLMLTFTYRNEGTSTSNGTLYVSYMTDPTDASTFNTEHAVAYDRTTTLTEKEVFFENAPAGSYIAFKYQGGSGNNMYLSIDDVKVELAPSCRKPSGLTKDATTAHTATLHWTNGSTDQDAWQIAYSTTSDFNPDEVTPIDVTTNPATIEGLSQSTTYYAYVRANCGSEDGVSAWCNNKLTFTTLAGNVTPTGLAVDNASITSSQATASWNAVAGNTLHQSYDIYWAESTVTAVPEEPAAPNLIAGITATSQDITGLEPETSYKVWVRDNCGTDGYSAWSSYVTFTTAAECQTPDGLAASNVTNESATITWNTYGQTGFNLQYSTDGTNWTPKNDVNTPYNLTGLTANTAYQVQVQATCNTEEWSTVLSFKTECDAITITDSYSYTEDFEEPVTTAVYNTATVANLVMPYCWDNYTNSTSGYAYAIPHLIKSSAGTNGYNYSSPASQVLYFYGYGNGYAALPEFTNDLNTLQISFKWATEGSTQGTLTLGYITAEDNGTYNTFTAIGESFAASSASYHQMKSEIVYLNAVPATATRLVFRWYYGSWYGANIDDIEVSLLPSCYPVGTLSAASDVTYNSAKLSWALVDDTQDEWTVQYATNATFTEGVETKTATINTNYELTGLTPETHYWVRVKAACSTTEDWSNAIDFETEVFCAVSVPTATNVTQTTADLSWTGESDSYNIQYRTAAVPTTSTIRTEDFESYADEEALEAVWTVIDLGDGSNTGELGLFEVSGNKVFRFSSFSAADYSNYSADDFDQYLISPELTKAGLLEFAYMSSNGTNDNFRVGYSSTTNDVSAFTWGAETNSTSSWKTYSETMPEDAKYFAINYTAVYQYRLYIDDIAIYEIQPAGTWQNTTSETESKQLTGLAAGTKYDVQVQGVCDGTPGNWSASYSFTTLDPAVFTKTIEAYETENDKGWYLIASPLDGDEYGEVAAADVANLITDPASNFALYRFNENATVNAETGLALEWENWKADEATGHHNFNLESGRGYLYGNTNGGSITFTGVPYSGTGEVPVTYTAGAEFAGWNLIGNPFGTDAYLVDASNQGLAYIRMNSTGNGFDEVANNAAIAPMEGIFYQATAAGKVYFSTTAPGAKSGNLNMTVSQGRGTKDNAIIRFGEGNIMEKFSFREGSTKVYIPQYGKDYAVVNAENQGTMSVNFKAEENGTYSLSFNAEEVSFSYLHLIDNMTGNDIDLLQTPSYTFNATTTDYESRFKLVFCTGVNDNSDSFAFCNNGNWIINNAGEATLQVIDVNGRILSSETVSGSVSKAIHAAPGVYMLRLINGDNVKVQKIVVR